MLPWVAPWVSLVPSASSFFNIPLVPTMSISALPLPILPITFCEVIGANFVKAIAALLATSAFTIPVTVASFTWSLRVVEVIVSLLLNQMLLLPLFCSMC